MPRISLFQLPWESTCLIVCILQELLYILVLVPIKFFQRFGHAITPRGVLNLRNRMYATDFGPIDLECGCPCCRPDGWGVTRSLIYHLACKETSLFTSVLKLMCSWCAFSYNPQCSLSAQSDDSGS